MTPEEATKTLFEIAKHGDYTVLKWDVRDLLGQGADVRATDKSGKTPLHYAAASGGVDVVCRMINAGADAKATDKHGKTPLHEIALGEFTLSKHEHIVRRLIEAGADVNAKDANGKTPLHLAAEKGHTDIAELLIKNGADLKVRDNDGRRPLDLAPDKGSHALKEQLRRAAKSSERQPGVG